MRKWLGIVIIGIAVGGCHSTTSSPPITTTTTTRAPVTTTTTAAPPDLIPQLSPDVASDALLSAWAHGDIPTASHIATPDALAQLFARPPGSYSARGCQVPIAGQATCSFGEGAALIEVHTVTLAAGWVVDQVIFE